MSRPPGSPPPRWLVSSPHRLPLPLRVSGPARPHGLHHAREVGSTRTACGANSLEWPFFWDLVFGDTPDECCPECVIALARLRRTG